MTTDTKPKLSRLALASLLIACIPVVGCVALALDWLFSWVSHLPPMATLEPVADALWCWGQLLVMTAFLLSPVVVIVGMTAIAKIRGSMGHHRGTRHAICAIVLSLLCLGIGMYVGR